MPKQRSRLLERCSSNASVKTSRAHDIDDDSFAEIIRRRGGHRAVDLSVNLTPTIIADYILRHLNKSFGEIPRSTSRGESCSSYPPT